MGRLVPFTAIYGIVEIGNQIAQGASAMAKRYAAVHAACALVLDFLFGKTQRKLLIVLHALLNGSVSFYFSIEFQKSCYLSHVSILNRFYCPVKICKNFDLSQSLEKFLKF